MYIINTFKINKYNKTENQREVAEYREICREICCTEWS